MHRRITLLKGLSVFALSGAVALSGCGGKGEGEGAEGKPADDPHQTHNPATGSSEGEGAAAAAAAEDYVAYASAMLAIKGHLTSGVELYRAGDAAGATSHMKHPRDELYSKLEPAFKKRRQPGFGAEIDALGKAVEGGEALGVVLEKQKAAFEAIDRHLKAGDPGLKDQLLAVAALVEIAGQEFDQGVKHGTIVSLHEYQDAHGFLSVAVTTLGLMKTAGGEQDAAVAAAREQAAIALAVAPRVMPDESISGESATIYGAAARIELKAHGLS